ncbi:hypothetical protein Mgra_00004278 [Meloidogyne graminicola]|uniref:Uncharacterized protein n=1 Tax=Meloidogyne graminicola TaxID=189291 RepID=A0A8S9ZT10_9BILA|nr:hypothetical protein Mgra_00004278 [Meloidogyne graminicola]
MLNFSIASTNGFVPPSSNSVNNPLIPLCSFISSINEVEPKNISCHGNIKVKKMLIKNIIIFSLIYLKFIQTQPPIILNGHYLEYEHFSMNGNSLNSMLPNIKEQLRQRLFSNAFIAIEHARNILPQANPNNPIPYLQENNEGNFNYILYHINQNNLVRTFPFHQQFINQTIQYNPSEYLNGNIPPTTFNQNIILNGNGLINLFYFIRCKNINNLEKFEYILFQFINIMIKIYFLLFLINLIIIVIQTQTPPINEFILHSEYYSINGGQLNNMLPHMKAALRQQLFNNAYLGIIHAREELPPPNPNEPEYFEDHHNDENDMSESYHFALYHQNLYNLIEPLPNNQQITNLNLPVINQPMDQYYLNNNNINLPNQFNQSITFNGNGEFEIIYFISCKHQNNFERIDYSEKHIFNTATSIIELEQSIMHLNNDGSIVRILQDLNVHIRQHLFDKAYLAIEAARNRLPVANPNNPINLQDANPNDGIDYDFVLYHQNQHNMVRQIGNFGQFVHQNENIDLPDIDDVADLDEFTQEITLNENENIIISNFIRFHRRNSLETFEYMERHIFEPEELQIQFNQVITHRDEEGTIISIIQGRVQSYLRRKAHTCLVQWSVT